MAKYKLCDWEVNGYSDSDFYGAFYDTEDGNVHVTMVGTTRFACDRFSFGPEYLTPTPEIVEKARLVLRARLFESYKRAAYASVMAPSPAVFHKGTTAVLLEDHSLMVPVKSEGECFKCLGTGKFKAGKFSGECFTCKGTGRLMMKTGEKLKGADGKCVRNVIKAGTKVTAYGPAECFKAHGGISMRRENSTVTVKVEGQAGGVRLPVKKLRLDQEVASDEVVMEMADRDSHSHNYGGAFGDRYAWDSNNWALAVAVRPALAVAA